MIRRVVIIAALLASVPVLADMIPSPSGRLRFFPGKDAEKAAQVLAQTADEDRDWASREVGSDYEGVTDVRVAIDPVTFAALQPPQAPAPPWASGVAYPAMNLVVIRVGGHEPDPRALLRHELSHVAVGRLTGGRAPRWLLEGLAVMHSGDAWNEEGPSLVQAALSNGLFRFEDLTQSFPAEPSDAEVAYAQSAAFVKYIVDRYGEEKIRATLREMVKGAGFNDAILRVTGSTAPELENLWRQSLSKWEMRMRVLTSREMLWGSIAVLLIFSGSLAWRRRRKRIRTMEAEEEADAMRALLRAPAVWADRPNESEGEVVPDEDGTVQPLGDDEDDVPEHVAETRDIGPKKPTLH